MLIIEDLKVEIGGQHILQHIDMTVAPGETHILFGPNGSGKTSLLMAIMGHPQYRVAGGKIFFNGQDITGMEVCERARLGIGMAFQRPPTIHGLKTRQMVEICSGNPLSIEAMARELNLTALLDRDINAGFSGGEIKRCELLQLMAQDPELMLFDEPESGVDVENLDLVGRTIAQLLQKEVPSTELDTSFREQKASRNKMGLIVTHTGAILDYLEADKGQVLCDGVMSCSSHARDVLQCIRESGYKECIRCAI